MTKFLYKTILLVTLLFFICCCIYIGILKWNIHNPNLYTVNSHEINVMQSYNKLQNHKEPSIIIIGGSGCGFGIISEDIFNNFKMPVINTGTHAGIGLRLQSLIVKPFIKKGDIILYIPEYSQFTYLFYGDETAIRIITGTYPNGINIISPRQHIYLSRYALKALRSDLNAQYNPPFITPKDTNTPYYCKSINSFGDVTMYQYRNHKQINTYKWKEKSVDKTAIDFVRDFRNYVIDCGASFVFLPPAYHEEAYIKNQEMIELITQTLVEANIPYHCSTERYMMPDSLFFDTSYHLTYNGCKYRTQLVIEDIDRILKKE